jgi:hypothetical protein
MVTVPIAVTNRSSSGVRSRLERSQVSPHPGQVRRIFAIRSLLPATGADGVRCRPDEGHQDSGLARPIGIL